MYPGGVQVKTTAVFSYFYAELGRWRMSETVYFPPNNLYSKSFWNKPDIFFSSRLPVFSSWPWIDPLCLILYWNSQKREIPVFWIVNSVLRLLFPWRKRNFFFCKWHAHRFCFEGLWFRIILTSRIILRRVEALERMLGAIEHAQAVLVACALLIHKM